MEVKVEIDWHISMMLVRKAWVDFWRYISKSQIDFIDLINGWW